DPAVRRGDAARLDRIRPGAPAGRPHHRPNGPPGGARRGRRRGPGRTAHARVGVAARPGRLTVEPGGGDAASQLPQNAAAAGWTSVPGRITQGTYLGEQTEFRINTDLAGALIVRRQNVTGASGGSGLGPGDPVVVRWHEDANL